MNILSLDLGNRTGWAHSNGESGTQDFSLRRGDSPGMRFLEFHAWLVRMYDLAPFELIAYEKVVGSFRSGPAARVLYGLATHMDAFAAEYKLDTTSRSAPELKKFALDGVSAKKRNKAKMCQVVENNWSHVKLESDDQADAILLLWFVMQDLKIENTPWHSRLCV